MSTARLTLYPHFFRLARVGESATPPIWTTPRRNRTTPPQGVMHYPPTTRSFASSSSPKQSSFRRHGKAVEPEPHPKTEEMAAVKDEKPATTKPESSEEPPKPTAALGSTPPDTSAEYAKTESATRENPAGSSSPVIELGPPQEPAKEDTKKDKSGSPMDTILSRSPLESMKKPPPHLVPPPYVHHFDSYSLVKHLTAGGYTADQAITAMKAVRALLAQNLDVAQEGLVSKSDVENEVYLFKAACSELSAEVKNNRRLGDELLRQQRTTLQHEVDNLTQTLNQDGLNLNDAVRGMFNDRKMAVREGQKTADSAIQQINYKITVKLNSDAKSEIERLRGMLIRRAMFVIFFCATLTLATLQYASYLSHAKAKEAERKARDVEALRRSDGRNDNSSVTDAAAILAAS